MTFQCKICTCLGTSYTITCGEHLLNEFESGQIDFDVTEVITHPKYTSAANGYDIAVFKVDDQKANTANRQVKCQSRKNVEVRLMRSC